MTKRVELWVTHDPALFPLMRQLGLRTTIKVGMPPDWNPSQIIESMSAPRNDGFFINCRKRWFTVQSHSSRVGAHLVWNRQEDSLDDLGRMMSMDSPLWDGFDDNTQEIVRATWVPGQERWVMAHMGADQPPEVWERLADLADIGGAKLAWWPIRRASIPKTMVGIFDAVVLRPEGERVVLPNGKVLLPQRSEVDRQEDWIKLVGVEPDKAKMEGPVGTATRRALEILSFHWATLNWDSRNHLERIPHQDDWAMEVARIGAAKELLELKLKSQKTFRSAVKPLVGDLIACDSCSLAPKCRLARAGSVCVVPESDMGELAEHFNTRDVSVIVGGLGALLGAEADRVEMYLKDEDGDPDPVKSGLTKEVTAMVHGLFDRGIKLAKLLDPALAGGPKIAVNLTNNVAGQVSGATPQQLMAAVVAQLESKGVNREDITEEMIMAELGVESDDHPVMVEAASRDSIGLLPEVI